jgi:hypothetical protein
MNAFKKQSLFDHQSNVGNAIRNKYGRLADYFIVRNRVSGHMDNELFFIDNTHTAVFVELERSVRAAV